MEPTDRENILNDLSESRERVRAAVAGLSPAQWSFQPGEDRWSIADCVEHLAIIETVFLSGVQRTMEDPAAEPKRSPFPDRRLPRVRERLVRVKAPDRVVPRRQTADPAEILGGFEENRTRTIEYAGRLDGPVRERCFSHPFLGDLDCCQWLQLISYHCDRHILQIEEIKTSPGFPSPE